MAPGVLVYAGEAPAFAEGIGCFEAQIRGDGTESFSKVNFHIWRNGDVESCFEVGVSDSNDRSYGDLFIDWNVVANAAAGAPYLSAPGAAIEESRFYAYAFPHDEGDVESDPWHIDFLYSMSGFKDVDVEVCRADVGFPAGIGLGLGVYKDKSYQ